MALSRPESRRLWFDFTRVACLTLTGLLLAACSGSSGDAGTSAGVDSQGNPTPSALKGRASALARIANEPITRADAARLLQQTSFGPNRSEIDRVAAMGSFKYLVDQLGQPASQYTYTLLQNQYRSQIHKTSRSDFCSQFGGLEFQRCWRDWFSHLPVQWDFFRQAVSNQDQLRQRVALALSQLFVVSARDVKGTYAIARYQQMLRDQAFGNFRELLEKVTRSPVMGEYLNLVDNDGADPNENYARELLQLFSIGPCRLDLDGTMPAGQCEPTYGNDIVRNYAYALSGWTYPPGGVNPWCPNGCDDQWGNPKFFGADMVPVESRHDKTERELLSGVSAPAGRSAGVGLKAVLDSIIAHPNVGPFISGQMIQFLVTSNPSPAYVARVSTAFNTGRYQGAQGSIGTGRKGDMRAMLAAILLDPEARSEQAALSDNFGRLRDPVLAITGPIRAMDGRTDGVALGEYGWARRMDQSVFASPSVFNFYSPMQPLNGTDLVAPRFGIDNVNTNLARINYANALVYWWYRADRGSLPDSSVNGATGTRIDYRAIEELIVTEDDSLAAVDALNELLVDGRLSAHEKQVIVSAMQQWTPAEDQWLVRADLNSNWRREQVRTALYLILASPTYQVQR